MIVTIDGPAGAGKSSVARRLAQRLGFCFLDTGAMYRTIALAAMREKLDWADQDAVASLAAQAPIALHEDRVMLGDEDVSEAIRSADVTVNTRHVANNPRARQQLVALQRRLAEGSDIVTEGRDQGTVAFPQADCKFYLTASSEERARRRMQERQARGENVSLDQVLDEQNRRDQEDESRKVGRLKPADDAIVVNTDGLGLEQVVHELLRLWQQRMRQRGNG